MKCPYCNQEIEDGSIICLACGQSLIAKNQPAGEAEPEMAADAVAVNETMEVEQSTAGVPVSDDGAAPAGGEKKNNKKVIVIGSVVALAAVIGIGVSLMPKKSGKDTVIDAFKSIVAEGQTNPMDEIFGSKALSEVLTKESSEYGFELRLEDSSNEMINQFATGQISLTAKNDVANNKMSLVMGIGYADMNLANLQMYMDDKQLAMAIPEMSKKSFILEYAEDLEGQVENSPFVGPILYSSGFDISGYSNYFKKANEIASSGKELFNVNELWTRYKEGSKAIDDLKAAMTVANADKKTFTINGKEESCKGYNVTITKDALIQFITTSKEFFLSDETLKKDFVDYMSLTLELQSMMGTMVYNAQDMSAEEFQQEAWRAVDAGMEDFITQLKESMSDVTMVVYVAKGDKMASFDYSTTANIEGEDIKLYGTVTFGGGYSMMSNVNATLIFEDMTTDAITLTVDKTGTYEAGKTYAGGLTMSASYDTDTYSMVSSADYAVDGGAYNVIVDLQSNGSSVGKLTSKGVVQNLVKGKSYELIMDSIKLETNMLTGMDDYIDFSGLYKIAPLSSEVVAPAGESFDMLAGTEEEWTAIATEIMGNFYGLAMGFYN